MNEISKMMPIPKGALFTITTGEYSDYMVCGVFRAKEDIDTAKLLASWLDVYPEQQKEFNFKEDDFLASLSSILEPIDAFEWHLGDYSTATEMSVTKIDKETAE